jgi:hypothetical protein
MIPATLAESLPGCTKKGDVTEAEFVDVPQSPLYDNNRWIRFPVDGSSRPPIW